MFTFWSLECSSLTLPHSLKSNHTHLLLCSSVISHTWSNHYIGLCSPVTIWQFVISLSCKMYQHSTSDWLPVEKLPSSDSLFSLNQRWILQHSPASVFCCDFSTRWCSSHPYASYFYVLQQDESSSLCPVCFLKVMPSALKLSLVILHRRRCSVSAGEEDIKTSKLISQKSSQTARSDGTNRFHRTDLLLEYEKIIN